MKGREHLFLTLSTLYTLLIWIAIVFGSKITTYLNVPFLLMLTFLLIYVGSIAPDSDVKNKKSLIYTLFRPFGWFMRILEMIFSSTSGKKRGHRKLLHSYLGMAVSSFLLFVLLQIMFSFVHKGFVLEITVACLFFYLAQLLHKIQDTLYDKFAFFSVGIYLLFFVSLSYLIFSLYKMI